MSKCVYCKDMKKFTIQHKHMFYFVNQLIDLHF